MAFNAYLDKMVCGLHFDGSNGSITPIDIKGNTWVRSNQWALSTSEKKFGTASGWFSGDGGGPDFITMSTGLSNCIIGTNDFTTMGWVKVASNDGSGHQLFMIGSGQYSTQGLTLWINRDTPGCIRLQHLTSGSYDFNVATGNMNLGTTDWHYIGARRSGSSVEIWCDGTMVA
jgi:hypothetical protein